ncbi:MAG: hypothetical protein ACRDTG_29835 [Pseudonocardiaceae bacterium]
MAKKSDRKVPEISNATRGRALVTTAGTHLLVHDGDLVRLVLILEATHDDPGYGRPAVRGGCMWLLRYSLLALVVAAGVLGGGFTVTFDVLSCCASVALLVPRRR